MSKILVCLAVMPLCRTANAFSLLYKLISLHFSFERTVDALLFGGHDGRTRVYYLNLMNRQSPSSQEKERVERVN